MLAKMETWGLKGHSLSSLEAWPHSGAHEQVCAAPTASADHAATLGIRLSLGPSGQVESWYRAESTASSSQKASQLPKYITSFALWGIYGCRRREP